jgi:hypothetical protein
VSFRFNSYSKEEIAMAAILEKAGIGAPETED